jgi:hypothetical protein
MDFKTAAQKACYEKVAPWMKELFGEFAIFRDDAPVVIVPLGSTYATTAVYPWGDDDATITTRAYVVTKVELTPDLMHYLLKENDSMRFGAFGVDDDKDVFFEHTIVGSTCDKGELRASVLAVVRTADQYDDQIMARWGGQRALDRVPS